MISRTDAQTTRPRSVQPTPFQRSLERAYQDIRRGVGWVISRKGLSLIRTMGAADLEAELILRVYEKALDYHHPALSMPAPDLARFAIMVASQEIINLWRREDMERRKGKVEPWSEVEGRSDTEHNHPLEEVIRQNHWSGASVVDDLRRMGQKDLREALRAAAASISHDHLRAVDVLLETARETKRRDGVGWKAAAKRLGVSRSWIIRMAHEVGDALTEMGLQVQDFLAGAPGASLNSGCYRRSQTNSMRLSAWAV